MQGFRMRLVGVLDEVLALLRADPTFRYTMDGQTIPISDYLEVRPERREDIQSHVRQGRLKIGPWFVAPDEWLVSGESLIRNLEFGLEQARALGGEPCRAGLLCDQFGHIGQMPQLFEQFGISTAYIWRGTSERKLGGHFLWQSPDGTRIPTYRFGRRGYGMLAYLVRNVFADQGPFDPIEAVDRLVNYTRLEASRSPLSPILLYDGSDHMEVEPRMAETIAAANKQLAGDQIQIVASDLDAYQTDVQREQSAIGKTIVGELRETSGDLTEGKPDGGDEQWLIAGTYASRIHLKQRNAACEDELCLWAEPFSTFASEALGVEYPQSLLKIAWRHLLENHPHDSMCGCSTDQVHQDMIYRFDQSFAISSRLTATALHQITLAAFGSPGKANTSADNYPRPAIGLFNSTAEPTDEPIDFDVYLPNDWPTKFAEFFGFEQKFSFRLRGPAGEEIPYQIVAQRRDVKWRHTERYKLSAEGTHHQITVCARVHVPAFGYTTVIVEPLHGPTRYSGSLAASSRSIENAQLRVSVNPNGTIRIDDKRTGEHFDQLLTIEERADIGDGWFHGVAVNDRIITSAAASAEVARTGDGRFRSTLRIGTTLMVPEQFDFREMRRSENLIPLSVLSEVTLREGSDRIEVTTVIQNTVRDHRIRMLFPTDLNGDTFESDSQFDVVRRSIALPEDNDQRRELDLETRPQTSWTAFGDGKHGLAIISRGLPEIAVNNTPDRAIALTLLRGFKRVISRDDDLGGQVLGEHRFRYDILPFTGATPTKRLFISGQRLHSTVRQASLAAPLFPAAQSAPPRLPRSMSFLNLKGDVVVTSIRKRQSREIRVFNPAEKPTTVVLRDAGTIEAVRLDGAPDQHVKNAPIGLTIAGKRIATLRTIEGTKR
jgi:alpha-mannosidase/mannosylglycerate hydrolase